MQKGATLITHVPGRPVALWSIRPDHSYRSELIVRELEGDGWSFTLDEQGIWQIWTDADASEDLFRDSHILREAAILLGREGDLFHGIVSVLEALAQYKLRASEMIRDFGLEPME